MLTELEELKRKHNELKDEKIEYEEEIVSFIRYI